MTQARRGRDSSASQSVNDDGSDDGQGANGQGPSNHASGQDVKKKAATVVRLALALHTRHAIIRRDDILKVVHIDPPVSQSLASILDEARRSLRRVFAMDLVPLKTVTGQTAKSWTIVSTLADDSDAVARMRNVVASTDSSYGLTGLQIDEAAAREAATDWDQKGEATSIAILQVVLALILGSGRVITDGALHSYLKKLGMLANTPLSEMTSTNPQTPMTLNRLLLSFTKQSYLDYTKVASGTSTGPPKVKRSRTGPSTQSGHGDEDGALQAEWRWGPRAHAEIGEERMAEWVGVIFGGGEDEHLKVARDFLRAAGDDME